MKTHKKNMLVVCNKCGSTVDHVVALCPSCGSSRLRGGKATAKAEVKKTNRTVFSSAGAAGAVVITNSP